MQTLPARYYTDTGFFHEEIQSFFFDSWVWVGRAEAIPEPGNFFTREIAGESIIVLRGEDETVAAFYNVCRHRGTRLCPVSEGAFRGRIQCLYHGWTYAFDGRLLGAPHMDAATFDQRDYPLNKLHTAIWDGHIFVHAGAQPAALLRQLGGLPAKFAAWRMAELRLHKKIKYELKANWKLIVSNYNECLHCPVLHPALNRLTDYLGADNEPPQPGYLGGVMGFQGNVETMSTDGQRRREYLPGLSEDQRKQVCYYVVYPNLLLSLHPDYLMVHSLWPRAVDRTEVICEWYFHPSELAKPDFFGSDAVEFWDLTNREDWRIVELSQQGIESRAYAPGPYSKREELLYAFDQVVLERERERNHGKTR